MKLIKKLVLSSMLLTVMVITSCSEQSTTSIDPGVTGQQLSKTANTAVLHIYSYYENQQTINIYGVSSDWTETGVTWNTQPTTYGTLEGSFVTNVREGWITTDITALVNKWLNGTYVNYGLLIETVGTNLEQFDSKENTNKPYLVITYSDGTENVLDIADAEINELRPTENFGLTEYLFAGIVNGYQKKSLIKFDVNYVPEVSCETSYAYDGDDLTSTVGTCFSDLGLGFSNWGWSIKLPGTGTYTFPVYAGAGQCDITKGTYVGDVTVVYAANGIVTFTYDFEPGFSASETHFYAGKTKVQYVKGKPTVAPGQYKIAAGLTGEIYIIAHAVVCSSDWD
jgi:hypothetical protein